MAQGDELDVSLAGYLVHGFDDMGHDTVLNCFIDRHPVVAIGVFLDALQWLPGFIGNKFVDTFPGFHNLFGLYTDVSGVALCAPKG